jgi:hypothetical protein
MAQHIDLQAWINYRDELTRYYQESGLEQAAASHKADRAMLRELCEGDGDWALRQNGRNGSVTGSFIIEETLIAHWKVYSLDPTTGRRCWRGTFRERRDAVAFVKAAQAD